MLERLKKLSELNGVSGAEGPVRACLRAEAEAMGLATKTDALGNLIVHRPGTGPRVMLTAHMDEVGMIVREITDAGMLRFDVGGIDPRVLPGKRVTVGPGQVPGVIGSKAIHLQTPEERSRMLRVEELCVDIGAKDREDAEKAVSLGDTIAFATRFGEFGNGLIKGKAFDDRIGCTLVMELLHGSYDCDLYGVFTVQEELGSRGAAAAARRVEPDLVLNFEGTLSADIADTPAAKTVTTIGGGAALSFMDRSVIVPERMLAALKKAARMAGVPFQLRRTTSGGTDAGVIHRELSGIVAGGINVPCRYIHSPVSVCSPADIESAYRIAHTFLSEKLFLEVL